MTKRQQILTVFLLGKWHKLITKKTTVVQLIVLSSLLIFVYRFVCKVTFVPRMGYF